MPNIKSSYNKIYFIAAIISGASLTLSFAPFRLWIFSYLSIASLIFLLNHSSVHIGYLGFFWGLGFFGSSVSWIFVSIYRYGGTSWLLSAFITSLFICLLSLFPAIHLILLKKFKLTNINNWRFLIAFPASWVLIEIFRSWIFTGFPWVLLGYTQLNSWLKYYASCFGVYGVSFIVAFIASLLCWGYYKKLTTKIIVASLILILFGLALLLKNINFASDHKKTNTVAIIQGNIAPDDKFLFQDINTLINRINEIYFHPTVNLFDNNMIKPIDLVIWPENSLPLATNHPDAQYFLHNIDQFAKQHNFGLLLGVPIAAKNYNYFYNSVLGLGMATGVYHKINLVPFGDYVPFELWLRGIINFFNLPMSSFIPGKHYQPGIIFNNNKILATVCYDIVYASQLRNRVVDLNPSVIVAVSEDGWFGDSLGPHQHLDIARMRAIETGKYILRATTSGISAIIDNYGNIVKDTPMLQKSILIGLYQDCLNNTIWNKIGNNPIILFLITGLTIAIMARRDV